ncbi:hypothetical protein BP422_00005 [Brevibacillus formosus]|uniref:Uncharacterized protein n=1 Tax=Brevibacillus formosus TaxID=54913 RepID=A0A220MQR7_9BACL|nr:hypothetical protein [Brevibacillus formosus]ASJ57401.1 hypothetical protein BP422_00005 [Brevibacillus formosus]
MELYGKAALRKEGDLLMKIMEHLHLEHFRQMEQLELQYYDAEFITPYQESYNWYLFRPDSVVAIEENERIIAFMNLLPVNKKQSIVHSNFHYPDVHAKIVSSSQMPTSYPFTVGYEAYFEKAKLVFQEADSQGQTESFLWEYTSSSKNALVLEPVNPYEESLHHAIQCFADHTTSFIDVDHAVESLELALALQKQLAR